MVPCDGVSTHAHPGVCCASPTNSTPGSNDAVADVLAEANVLDLPRQEEFERAQQREARKLGLRTGTGHLTPHT